MVKNSEELGENNQRQLGLLAELSKVLGEARIRFWLRGGWALDFHLGRVTRTHADIDLVTWRRHRNRLRRLLEGRGYEVVETDYPEAELKLLKLGEDLTFVFIATRSEGMVVTPGFEWWPWPNSAFSGRVRTLRGITATPLTAAALLAEKEEYEAARGRPLRPKDHLSIEALRGLLGDSPDTG